MKSTEETYSPGFIDKLRMRIGLFFIRGTSIWKDENKEQQIQDIRACSFCGKFENQVKIIIAGPSVFICNECAKLCNDILKEEGLGE